MPVFKLTVNKTFAYKGAQEEYSNSYHFNGVSPANQAGWDAWAAKIKDLEKTMLPATVTFVDWYGYEAGSWEAKPTHFDFHGVYAGGTVGTLATGGAPQAPGDTAFWIRYSTGQLTSPGGKTIYMRNYYHPALISTSDPDHLLAAQKTAANAVGAAMHDGASLIGTARLSRKTGTLVINHAASDFVTTRTLKRRGKRNPT